LSDCEINIQRELACDAWVLERVNNPLAYSKSLYQLALVANQEQNEFILNAIGSEKEILTRIKFLNKLPIQSTHLLKQLAFAFFVFVFSSIDFTSKTLKQTTTLKQSAYNITAQVQDHLLVPKSQAIHKKDKQVYNKIKQSIEITTLKTSIIPIAPVKDEEYTAIVSKAANWIKERENPYQFINYSTSRDSLEFEIAEKLMLRSLLQNYQLRKELLNAKLANIASEREAMDFLEHSKELKDLLVHHSFP
jgi:arsenate reductase-like glutaredoxin family protein